MKYIVSVLISCCFVTCCSNSIQKEEQVITLENQMKIYKLIEHIPESDLNYKMLNDFNSSVKKRKGKEAGILEIFRSVEGKCHYYKFIAKYKGEPIVFPDEEPNSEQTVFHDILILKTDSLNTIIDGYQYTIEWGESPFDSDLYRVTVKGIPLKKNLNIKELKMQSIYDKSDFEQEGILDLQQ